MRFAELHLIRYGRFEDCHLAFPHQASDLQIVFGPNEAGKSTTMAAVGDLLFGFPHRTPYDFRFDMPLLRVGAVLQAEGRELVCRRKKGRTGTLLDGEDRLLDEGALAAMLAGHTAESFRRMFSLDHAGLREGGQAILAAQDDVGRAIFAAGSGLVGVTRVLEALEAESKEIWTRSRRGAGKRYHAAQSLYDDARARQRAAQIRPAAWEDLRKQIERLDEKLAESRRHGAQIGLEREAVERRRRVLPQVALYRLTLADLEALEDVPDFPIDAAGVLADVATTVATANTEKALAETARARAMEALEALEIDGRLIEHATAIDALREAKGAIDKSLADLPRRRAEAATRIEHLADMQRELGWPEEEAGRVRARLPQRSRLADVRDLLEVRSGLDASLAEAKSQAEAAKESLHELEAELAGLPPQRDPGALTAAILFARNLGDIEGRLRTAERDAGRRQAALANELARLSPWSGETDDLDALVLPTEGQNAEALAGITRAELALAEARRDQQAAADHKAALDLRLLQLMRDESAVAPDAVQQAREDRDALWRGVRAHLIDESALPDPLAAAAEFERRSGVADGVADRRFSMAEQSARLAALLEEIERNDLTLGQLAARTASATIDLQTVEAEWQALLSPSGLRLAPAAFTAWSERSRRALEAKGEHEAALQALADILGRLEGGRTRLAAALGALGAPETPDPSFGRLLEAAALLEEGLTGEARQRRDITVGVASAATAVKDCEKRLQGAKKALVDWDGEWVRALAAAALQVGDSPAAVRAKLDIIGQLRADVDEVLALQKRIDDMEADITKFEARVAQLARFCCDETKDRTSTELLAEMAKSSREMVGLQTRREGLEEQLATAEGQVDEAGRKLALAMARLEPLIAIAGTGDREALAAAIESSETARALREVRGRQIGEIVAAGGGPELETLLAECEGADAGRLAVRGDELQDELNALSETVAQLSGDRATARAAFDQLDDGPDAAVAAADAEQARAEMAVEAEAYVRVRAEAALLKWAIAKYRAENETPLLKRASELFSRLTLGRYSELLVDLDDETSRLAGLDQDQGVVPVGGMSDGTVDQLFLALRLAAVEDAVTGGRRLPFLADDLFINYDDARAAAGFQVLAELARSTQVLFFTHHQHLLGVAERALAPARVSSRALA